MISNNLIIMTLTCGGADGCAFYLGSKYIGYAISAYNMEHIIPKILEKMDKHFPLEFRTVDLDKIDIYEELEQIDTALFSQDDPDYWTEQELEAIYNNDLELLEKLVKERCNLDG